MNINEPHRIVAQIKRFSSAIFLNIVGIALVIGGIYFKINTPINEETGKEDKTLWLIFLLIGIVLIALGIFFAVKAVKKSKASKPLSEEEVKENLKNLDNERPDIENVEDLHLYFHFGGKMNQSYFAEDKDKRVLFECKMAKFSLVNDIFVFSDVDNNYSKEYKMGKPTNGSIDDYLTSSYFKIDGVNCWDYLRMRGYQVNHYALEGNGRFMRYEVVNLGQVVANIYPANFKNPWGDEKPKLLSMAQGCYRIDISNAKLADIMMIAFIISRTDMVE